MINRFYIAYEAKVPTTINKIQTCQYYIPFYQDLTIIRNESLSQCMDSEYTDMYKLEMLVYVL